jgi:predicted amidohydrolase
MCLVLGFAERIGDDVFNCAAFIDDKGTVSGKYHKMQFAEGYDDSWWFNRLGQKSRAFSTPFGRCGILICNDRWNAQLARIPALDGAQFLVIPSYGSRSLRQDKAVLSHGQENGVPIIEANVGVTLIVSDDRIAAVDRHEDEEGITFGEIRIPPPRPVDVEERDRVEREFLEWRQNEMRIRYKDTLERLQKK